MFCVCLFVCIGLCLFPSNSGEYFVLLLVEPIAGKNVSSSDEKKFGDFWKTS